MVIAISDPIKEWATGPGSEEINKDVQLEWHITGLMSFLDPPREDTAETIVKSQAYGCPVVMITGDHALIAVKTCKVLEMGKMDGPKWPDIHGPEKLPLLDEDGKAPDGLVENYGGTLLISANVIHHHLESTVFWILTHSFHAYISRWI
jgi:magnesium-transporting ATPase (P-type)